MAGQGAPHRTGGFTDTTDTAANIIAALPLPAVIGECFTIEIVNTTIYPQTIAAGSGVTLAGLAGPNPANSTLRAWLQYTSAGAVTITVVEMSYNAVGGYEPSTVQTQFGSGTQTFLEEGNINRQISAAGVSPGATGADNVLAVYTLPANSFDIAGRGIYIQAQGTFAANVHNKDVKVIFNPATAVVGSTVGTGGSVVCDTGVVTTSGGGWQVSAFVYKYGAAGSNTQMGLNSGSIAGSAHLGTAAPVLITATENAAILVAITGNATTTASDIVFNWLECNALN